MDRQRGRNISETSMYGSLYIQFLNWGIATGMLKYPDSSTIMVYQIEAIASSIILAIGMIVNAAAKRS